MFFHDTTMIKQYKIYIKIHHKNKQNKKPQVLYMFSSFWLLQVKSRDFSQAEKERTACNAEQIHKMTTILTQNGPRLSF